MKAIATAPTAGSSPAGRAPRGRQIKQNGRVVLAATNLPAYPAILPKATDAIIMGTHAPLQQGGLPSGNIAPSVLAMGADIIVRAARLATMEPIAMEAAKGLVRIRCLTRAKLQGINPRAVAEQILL